MRRASLIVSVVLALGCGGDDEPTAPAPPKPASVVVTTASLSANGSELTATFQNNGGGGDFIIDLWGYKTAVGCKTADLDVNGHCPYVRQSKLGEIDPIHVTAGYHETLVITPAGSIATITIRSRGLNTAIYSQSSCYIVRNFGAAACPNP